jgi:uroporphyrin-3 C-methyltransferase
MVDPLTSPEVPVDETRAAALLPDAAAATPGAHRGVSRALAAVLAMLLGVLIVLSWLDGRRSVQTLRVDAAQRLGALDAAGSLAKTAQAQLGTELRDAQAKIALLETRVAESQAQQAALEALYRDLAPSRDEIALTEIEQVLVIASQQLQLAGNVSSALSALQLAETKLQRLDRPQFVALRRALGRDIDVLKATPYVDVAGLSLKLDQALATIDGLPLARDERVPPSPSEAAPAVDEPDWRRLLRAAWAELRQLVRIEVSDRPAAPLLPPAQSYFLRENLKLRLLSARIALLNREDSSYRADITAADAWLRQYFDLRAKPVQSIQAALKQAAAMPAPTPAPDLARSLEARRLLKLAQDRPANRAQPR